MLVAFPVPLPLSPQHTLTFPPLLNGTQLRSPLLPLLVPPHHRRGCEGTWPFQDEGIPVFSSSVYCVSAVMQWKAWQWQTTTFSYLFKIAWKENNHIYSQKRGRSSWPTRPSACRFISLANCRPPRSWRPLLDPYSEELLDAETHHLVSLTLDSWVPCDLRSPLSRPGIYML